MICIRPIRDGEEKKVVRLLKKCAKWNVLHPAFFTLPTTLILVVGKRILGTATIRDDCRVGYVAVHPNHRGKGYGYLLMKAAEAYFKKNPYLYVKMWNVKAIRLYLNEGYEITGRRRFSFKMERRIFDAIPELK